MHKVPTLLTRQYRTQQMINSGLQAQHDWASSTQGRAGKTQNFVLPRSGEQGIYNVVFGAPRILINHDRKTLNSCIYRWTVKSGELRVAPSDDEDTTMTSFWLDNFCVAIPINMMLRSLVKNDKKYQEIREKMNKPGDYSIHQLLVDFQSK